MGFKMNSKFLIYGVLPIILVACSSGSSSTDNASYGVATVQTFNYNPGNKTAVMVSIGDGTPVVAEIDTGSQLTVVNESFVGSNITKTSESLQIIYGAGTNTVSGYLAYGSVKFTTTNGETLSTSSNTPLLVVTSGSVNQGGANNAILGMRVNTQVSSRLFLPYPYNQMMLLNRSESYIAFGNLTSEQLSQFALINQVQSTCDNLGITQTASNPCWVSNQDSVTYSYSIPDDQGGGNGDTNYTTIFDSGEAVGNFYLESIPSWMTFYGSTSDISNNLSATLNTNKGPLLLPLTSPTRYTQPLGSSNTVNPGNAFFNSYMVLFDQTDGYIGFVDYNESLGF